MMSSYKRLPCRKPRHMKGTDVRGCCLPQGRFSDDFAAVWSQGQACWSMASDQDALQGGIPLLLQTARRDDLLGPGSIGSGKGWDRWLGIVKTQIEAGTSV